MGVASRVWLARRRLACAALTAADRGSRSADGGHAAEAELARNRRGGSALAAGGGGRSMEGPAAQGEHVSARGVRPSAESPHGGQSRPASQPSVITIRGRGASFRRVTADFARWASEVGGKRRRVAGYVNRVGPREALSYRCLIASSKAAERQETLPMQAQPLGPDGDKCRRLLYEGDRSWLFTYTSLQGVLYCA